MDGPMAKLDAYLRSIEKFGAAGAVLTSGQPVTLKFPNGDRNATQVTPHDQLVGMVRELAPPQALDAIDQHRPARFDVESEGKRYLLSVSPRPGVWQVTIEPATAAPSRPTPQPGVVMREHVRAQTPPPVPVADAGELAIERGQYGDAPAEPVGASASVALDQLTRAARQARASDLYLSTGSVLVHRVGADVVQAGASVLDAETIAREVGIVATAEARAAWNETGIATFAYSDGGGRIRVTLGRDAKGPTAALRLLPDEAPALERVNLGKAGEWLGGRGLVLVVGAAGAGKTVALASLMRALGDRGRRVISIEQPIEMVIPSVSQRAVGEHVPSVAAGVAAALAEGADAIAIGSVASADAAAGLVDAVAGGALVFATVTAANAGVAVERIVGYLDANLRDMARSLLGETVLGTVRANVRGGTRSYEVSSRTG
jgi:Tfp pilus assembly pilus retraction ATPase PilT